MLRQRQSGGHAVISAHRLTQVLTGTEKPIRRKAGPLWQTNGQSATMYRVDSSGNPGWSLNSNLRESLENLGKKMHTVKNF